MQEIYMKKEDIPKGTICRVRVFIDYYDEDEMKCSEVRSCKAIKSIEEQKATENIPKA